MELEMARQIGIRAAYRAGKIQNTHFGQTQVSKKGVIDLVTAADIESEKAIIETIAETYPDHSILAEESGIIDGAARYQWIIDPLDGTTNYAHSLPIYSVSIAFAQDDEIVMGIVLNPASGELFTAIKGQGAQLNGQPIQVSKTSDMVDALLVTGFPYTVRDSDVATSLIDKFTTFLMASRGVRRLGSAALDLCYVACGRFDGFWEEHLKPWDTAAGMLIAMESGGQVSDFSDHPYHIHNPEVLATNGYVHQDMVALLATKDHP